MLTGSIPPTGLPASKLSLLLICFSQILAYCSVFHFPQKSHDLRGVTECQLNKFACFYECYCNCIEF